MKPYYVVLVRRRGEINLHGPREIKDYSFIMSGSEAVERGWVDDSGNRIWVCPLEYESVSNTFVFPFDDQESALAFAIGLAGEIGIKTESV